MPENVPFRRQKPKRGPFFLINRSLSLTDIAYARDMHVELRPSLAARLTLIPMD